MLRKANVEIVIGYLSWVSLLSGLGWFYYSELHVLATNIQLKQQQQTKQNFQKAECIDKLKFQIK